MSMQLVVTSQVNKIALLQIFWLLGMSTEHVCEGIGLNMFHNWNNYVFLTLRPSGVCYVVGILCVLYHWHN